MSHQALVLLLQGNTSLCHLISDLQSFINPLVHQQLFKCVNLVAIHTLKIYLNNKHSPAHSL